jgi:hypothetical protein
MNSNIIDSIYINGTTVNIIKCKPDPVFNGQKIMHLFPYGLNEDDTRKWKFSSIYSNDPKKLVKEQIEELDKTLDLLEKCERFDVKHDGGCGQIRITKDGIKLYTRLDVRSTKNGKSWKSIPDNAIPCSEDPCKLNPDLDRKKAHWPHFIPVSTENDCKKNNTKLTKSEKRQNAALKVAIENGLDKLPIGNYSIEQMGKGFNEKNIDPIETKEQPVAFVIHGTLRINIPKELRTFEGIKEVLKNIPQIEGLVAYLPNGDIRKIRRDAFGFDWGNKTNKAKAKDYSKSVAFLRNKN